MAMNDRPWSIITRRRNRSIQRIVRACKSAGEAKKSAATPIENADSTKNRKSWFAIKHVRPREDWFEVKRDFMRRADMAKYSQNADLAENLLACGDAQIVEDSKSDSFWGVGRDG